MLLMIVTGSSGGHIMPAKAVIKSWLDKGRTCVWLGRDQSIEQKVAQDLNVPFVVIDPVNFRSIHVRNLFSKVKALRDWWRHTHQLLVEHQPKAIFVTGSYITVVPALVARYHNIAVIVHEQNTVMGFANQLLRHVAKSVLCGYPIQKAHFVGNPVTDVKAQPKRGGKKILVIGGSQGSSFLNETLPSIFKTFDGLEIMHICGQNLDALKSAYAEKQLDAKVVEFCHQMEEAYQWADMVVSRAGAMTLAEICANGLPALVVPLPSASQNHQYHNAKYYADKNALMMAPQEPIAFQKALVELITQEDKREQLSRAMRVLHQGDASEQIVNQIEKAIDD